MTKPNYQCNFSGTEYSVYADVTDVGEDGDEVHTIITVNESCYPGFVSISFDCTGMTVPVPIESLDAFIEGLQKVREALTDGR